MTAHIAPVPTVDVIALGALMAAVPVVLGLGVYALRRSWGF